MKLYLADRIEKLVNEREANLRAIHQHAAELANRQRHGLIKQLRRKLLETFDCETVRGLDLRFVATTTAAGATFVANGRTYTLKLRVDQFHSYIRLTGPDADVSFIIGDLLDFDRRKANGDRLLLVVFDAAYRGAPLTPEESI